MQVKKLFTSVVHKALEKWPADPMTTDSEDATQTPPFSKSHVATFSEFEIFTTQVTSQSAADKRQNEQVEYIEGAH